VFVLRRNKSFSNADLFSYKITRDRSSSALALSLLQHDLDRFECMHMHPAASGVLIRNTFFSLHTYIPRVSASQRSSVCAHTLGKLALELLFSAESQLWNRRIRQTNAPTGLIKHKLILLKNAL
jgi:hypothetical protein